MQSTCALFPSEEWIGSEYMENIPYVDELFCDLNAGASPLLISAVGAGGKTSTLLWLAEFFTGWTVSFVTTTTHMWVPTSLRP
ncbi:hypothetical protein ACLK2H_16240 [Escherichia coli]